MTVPTEGPRPEVSPVTVEGSDVPRVSRALWLVKWLLAIPHYFVLAFLGLGAVFVWIWAFFAILFTGRYPRGAFDYLLGVMRWSWRVQYYLYDVGGTDAYPPFTLADVPDYPARLDVRYPDKLSRGLVLVKWWLLAIPHYIILAVLFGYSDAATDTDREMSMQVNWPGLVPLLVLVALIALLFTGGYPRALYRLVMGFSRWQWRVVAYSALMTDVYPPFRLDQGPFEPSGPRLGAATQAPPGYGSPPTAPPGYGSPPTAPPGYGPPPQA